MTERWRPPMAAVPAAIIAWCAVAVLAMGCCATWKRWGWHYDRDLGLWIKPVHGPKFVREQGNAAYLLTEHPAPTDSTAAATPVQPWWELSTEDLVSQTYGNPMPTKAEPDTVPANDSSWMTYSRKPTRIIEVRDIGAKVPRGGMALYFSHDTLFCAIPRVPDPASGLLSVRYESYKEAP